MPKLKRRRLLVGLLLGAAGPVWAQNVWAQSDPTPNPAPDLLRERTGPDALPPVTPPPARPAPSLAPPLSEAPAPIATPQSAGGVTFSDVIVDGAGPAAHPGKRWSPPPDAGVTLERPGAAGLDTAWVRRQFLANGMIGISAQPDRVVALLQAINLAFARSGFVNSGLLVAPGALAPGAPLRLRLVTGRLTGPVTVRWGPHGRKGLDQRFVRRRMPAASAVPLDVAALERQFRLLAENPAIRSIDANLQPGANPGEASLALTVDPAPRFDLYYGFANSRSPTIGGERSAFGGSIRNALVPGDLLSGEAGVTDGRWDYTAGYEAPFLSPDSFFQIRGTLNNAAVTDATLRRLQIRARDKGIEGGLSRVVLARPLEPGGEDQPARAAPSLTLGLRFSHRRSDTSLLGQPFSFSPGAVDGRAEYTAARLTADYIERGVAQVLAVSLTATQGIEGTRGDVAGIPRPDRDFRALLVQVSLAHRLDPKGTELRLRFSGQVADGILYSNERFAAGGEYSVRGYRETLALADEGFAGTVELARPFSLIAGHRDRHGTDLGAFSLAAFIDGAVLRNRAGPAPLPDSLASVGASLTWTPSDAVFARITYAKALIHAPRVGERDLQDRGVEFRITVRPLLLFSRSG